jgi:hypothetical protein
MGGRHRHLVTLGSRTAADFAFRWNETKGSYATYEAAEPAGTGIKKHYPILQVAVYDGVEMNKVIELP